MFGPAQFSMYAFACSIRDAVSWVEMDYFVVYNRPVSLEAYHVSTRVRAYDRLLPAATAEVSAAHGG